MANAHRFHQYHQQTFPTAMPIALRVRAATHRTGGWRSACLAALAASAAAAASAQHTDDARLESDAHRRLVGFGAAAERFAHFTQQQQQQSKRNATRALAVTTTATASPVERETALAKQLHFNSLTWPAAAATAAGPTSPQSTTLRTKKIQHEYDVQGVIGEGGFGRVHIARHRASNAQVAIKRVFKESTTRDKFLQEVAILRLVGDSDASVLQLRDAFETPDAYVLVTELVSGGELFDNLLEHGVFDERRASTLTREIADALAFLHAKHVVHGDIKPENILMRDTGAHATSMRLVDFGQAFRDDKAAERARAVGSGVGTTAYAAPEFLSKREAGAAVDMWALGVVLYVLLCGRHPFDPSNDASDDEIAARIRAGDFASDAVEWTHVSASARDLVQRLLTVDPRERITAEQVLAHEWLQQTKTKSSSSPVCA